MPYKIIKLKGKKNRYKVVSANGDVKSANTTLVKAKAQIRLLNYMDKKKSKK